MAEPGWYPDPGGVGSRFWDGGAWTDRVVIDKPVGRGIPGWVLVGWWLLMAVAAVGAFWFVVLMTAFGCDSGWDGCVGAGQATWLIYAGICAVGLIGLLVWALLSRTPGPRIAAFILMPVTVLLAVLLAFAAYWLMATLMA
ncbi:MAG TPA: DUF2510 domain-containing protein [Actinomycetota bacterium]|nr:DUF2510 domain-containing protein [Actinomycetota bacterium]